MTNEVITKSTRFRDQSLIILWTVQLLSFDCLI